MKTETLTIMIIDLVGSTHFVEQSSRAQLVAMIEDVSIPVRQAVDECGGTIVKFMGDGYLITFQSASEALHAAARIVEAFNSQPTLPSGARLEGCRVVLHTSDVIVRDGDVLGEGVVTAARLEKHVPPNTVYLTNAVREVAKAAEFEFEMVGELLLRGLTAPIIVHKLVTEPFSGVEQDTYLTITDLLGMGRFVTEAPIDLVNRVMQRWIALQREAIGEVNGRLRAVVGDNLITSYESADQAVEALMRLDALVGAHNEAPGELPPLRFTAVTCKGDLFVLSLGVNGPLVSRGFRLLNSIDADSKVIEVAVYRDLTHGQERFHAGRDSNGETLYYLAHHPAESVP